MIKLEGYKIIKKIASGGMGDVYLAQHTVLETKVAIKSLHSNLVYSEDFRKRFRTEARNQSKLSHPNIVKLIDFQERKDGLFLIMEYVDGEQLNNHIRKISGPIPDDKLVPLFMQVLSAIKYAHSKGLIHRDIKPSNILITAEGNVKMIDFGIAKSLDEWEDKGLTKVGDQVGTPSYMSPEQVNAEKLDILTDIYSLGVTLFQMTTGVAPYAKLTNPHQIQTNIVSVPLPNPKDIYPGSTERLIKIINKATQKKKSDRYQTCEEFIKSFEEKVQTKKLNKTTEILEKKKPKEKIKKISFFQNKNNRVFFKTITVLLILGFGYQFVVKPFYPEIKNKWNTYQKEREIQKNKDEIAKANKIKQAAAARRLKKAAAAAAAKRKKELAEKAKADSLRKEADAERIRRSNLNAAQLEAERKRQEILALAEAKRVREEADAERIRISNLNAAQLEAQRKRQEILAIAEAKRVREEAEAEKIRKEKYNGKLGKEKLPNGDFYEGDWVSGDRTGKGILTFKDGGV
ncbi:protein kinase, partial [Flavobacteriaceae bacterium]|nr:protein kinase [Flavobacteriaceae bacterium]